MTQPSGRFHRCTGRCPQADVGRVGELQVGALPVPHLAAGVPRVGQIDATVRTVHPAPVRCGFRAGSAADGHGMPVSFSARAIRATKWPASRWANIHRTTCSISGSGSSR